MQDRVAVTAAGQAWVSSLDLVLVHLATLVVDATARALTAFTRAHVGPPRLSILYVLEGTAVGVPDEATRRAFVELSGIGDRAFVRTAIVVPSGFAAATARAFVSSVRLVARSPTPLTVVSNVPDALAWLRDTRVGATPRIPADLAVQELIAQLRDASR